MNRLHGMENGENMFTPAKLVYVRNRNKPKDYLVLISTDTTLDEDLSIASEKLFLSEEEAESLLALFIAALPEILKNKLKKRPQAAP